MSKVVLEVESEMLKGTFKLYPKLKAFYELQGGAAKKGIFEYGYCLKAFPDEPIQIVKEEVEQETNFFQNWLSKITNPLDTKDLNSDKTVTLKM